MKKFKDKLGKGSSHISMIEWTKHDDKMLDYTINNEENKLRLALLRRGISPLKKKSDGKKLLDVACEHGHVDCLGVLLERCADVISVSKTGSSALHTAAKSGNADCVLKLLTYKVRICSQDVDKMTALHHAASKGHADCVKVLITNGSKLNIRDKDGRTPLLIAIQAAREAIVRLLVENGAKVNLTDSAHKTPLMYASLIGLKDTVSTLLRHGANPLMRDTNGHQAEDFARISGYDDIVKIISNTPVLSNWSNAEEYEDDEDTPSQDGSVLGSNDGSDVASVLSHQDSDHGFGNVYSGERRLSSNSQSTSVSSSSAVKHESAIGRVQELERENNRLNVQLRTLRLEQSTTVECNNPQTMSNTVRDSATKDHTIVGVNGLNNNEVNDNQASVDLTDGDQRQLEILYNEINTLRRENERLKNEKDDINVDDSIPTIPITVYQQLKASAEEEVSTLNVNFHNIKQENENLRRQLSDLKRDTQDEMQMKAEQKIRALEKQVKRLQKQLVVADGEHSKTVNVYRLHLLSAIQGAMNTDVKKALELILKIRFDEQFC